MIKTQRVLFARITKTADPSVPQINPLDIFAQDYMMLIRHATSFDQSLIWRYISRLQKVHSNIRVTTAFAHVGSLHLSWKWIDL